MHKYHDIFLRMAGKFISARPSLQTDDSMHDLLVNEIYVRVLEMSAEKQKDKKTVVKRAYYACLDAARWHIGPIRSYKENKSELRHQACQVRSRYHTEDYVPVDGIFEKIAVSEFYNRLDYKSKEVFLQLICGYTPIEIEKLTGLNKKTAFSRMKTLRKLAKLYTVGIIKDGTQSWKCPSDQLLPLQMASGFTTLTSNLPEKEYIL